jgi:hypothetical protein
VQRLGDPSLPLHVGVERHRNGRQDSDDSHNDHELDQRETPLTAQPLWL